MARPLGHLQLADAAGFNRTEQTGRGGRTCRSRAPAQAQTQRYGCAVVSGHRSNRKVSPAGRSCTAAWAPGVKHNTPPRHPDIQTSQRHRVSVTPSARVSCLTAPIVCPTSNRHDDSLARLTGLMAAHGVSRAGTPRSPTMPSLPSQNPAPPPQIHGTITPHGLPTLTKFV